MGLWDISGSIGVGAAVASCAEIVARTVIMSVFLLVTPSGRLPVTVMTFPTGANAFSPCSQRLSVTKLPIDVDKLQVGMRKLPRTGNSIATLSVLLYSKPDDIPKAS